MLRHGHLPWWGVGSPASRSAEPGGASCGEVYHAGAQQLLPLSGARAVRPRCAAVAPARRGRRPFVCRAGMPTAPYGVTPAARRARRAAQRPRHSRQTAPANGRPSVVTTNSVPASTPAPRSRGPRAPNSHPVSAARGRTRRGSARLPPRRGSRAARAGAARCRRLGGRPGASPGPTAIGGDVAGGIVARTPAKVARKDAATRKRG